MKRWHIQIHRTQDNRIITWPFVGSGDTAEQAVIDVCRRRHIFMPFAGIRFEWRPSVSVPGLNRYFIRAHPNILSITRNGFTVTAYSIK